MAEVSPEDVLVIEREQSKSLYATDLSAVQGVIDHIGGAHNVHLARLTSAKKAILVEGKDMKVLKLYQDIVFPSSEVPFGALPNFSVGGWGGWREAVGSAKSMKNSIGQKVEVYCIFDRDFQTEPECQARLAESKALGIRLHIWSRKEIENYLLVPSAIARCISQRLGEEVPVETVDTRLDSICDELRMGTEEAIADAYQQRHRGEAASTALKAARAIVEGSWSTTSDKLRIISGKEGLARLSQWSQEQFGVSLSPASILKHTRPNEVPDEVLRVIRSIEENTVFAPQKAALQ